MDLKFNVDSFSLGELKQVLPPDVIFKNYRRCDLKKRYAFCDIAVLRGSENLYLELELYDLDRKKECPYDTIEIYSKENHDGLKELAIAFIKTIKL